MQVNYSPYIRHADENRILAPFFLERVIFDYELLYVKDGSVQIQAGDHKWIGKQGDLFLLKPGEPHSFISNSSHFTQLHVHFDLYQLEDSPEVKISFKPMCEFTEKERGWIREDVCSGPELKIPTCMQFRDHKRLERLFQAIIHEYKIKQPYYEVHLRGLFLELWGYMLRELFRVENHHLEPHYQKLLEVRGHIEQHLVELLTVDELARLANLSKYYFLRMFKEAFGVSPLKHQQLLRIRKAKESIQYSTLPIKDIAYSVGYDSVQSFTRAFSQLEGVPPTYYRHGPRS